MRKYLQLVLLASVGLVCNFGPLFALSHNRHHSSSSSSSENHCHFNHNIQLQLYDAYGVPVPDTQFWVTLKILKEGPKVTIQLPLINFETGPYANSSLELPPPPPIAGGYLYTADGFLPRDLRPNDNVYRTWLTATDNGALLSYSFTQDPSTITPPAVGYMVSITSAGALVVKGPGTVGSIIPPGEQTLLPTDISYIVEPRVKLKRNTKISTGSTNAAQFTNYLCVCRWIKRFACQRCL